MGFCTRVCGPEVQKPIVLQKGVSMNEERDFKGIWIPKEIWLNEELTILEKVIYVEIDSLDNENHCIAGNEYFANFCGCSESKVSKAIKKLEDLGMIETISFDGRHRKIRVVKNAMQGSKKCYAESQKMLSNNIVNKKDSKKDNSKELYTTTEFEFGKPKEKKSNLYSRCVALIYAKTTDEDIRKLLIEWLNMLLEKYRDRKKTLYENVFKGKLKTLDDYSEEEWKSVIKYNLQKGYEAFYPVKNYNKTNTQSDKPWEKGVNCQKATDEEEAENERWRAEQRKKGVKVDY